VAAAVQLAKEKKQALEAAGIPLTDFLEQMLITVAPRPLPSTSPLKLGEVPSYGRPTAYELFPFAPQWENDVLALFFILVGERKLKHKFLDVPSRPSVSRRGPDSRGV
jgi:hypothetical protein